jgi:hypothetical protein
MKHQFATLVVLGWIPFGILLFTMLRPRTAVLTAYLGAWLFLPLKAGLPIRMLPDIDKVTAASLAVWLGVMLFDPQRLFSFRFKWFDIPMVWYCLTPAMSSMANGLGYWDAMSVVLDQFVVFGIPYYIGRVYFNDWDGIRALAIAIFVGGVIYIPFCLLEIRLSPQLHRTLYGYHQHAFEQTKRMGGYRPMVFMQHGLAVGFWMTAATLVGIWLLVSGAMKKLCGIPLMVIVPVLFVTTILCKSSAGIIFLMMGISALFAIKWTKTALPLYCLILIAPMYMGLRASGIVTGEWGIEKVRETMGDERAHSIWTRINAENLLSEKAMESPAFGHGRWNPKNPRKPPWMVYDEETGKNKVIVDGMWILTMAINGLSGVVAMTLTILLPAMTLRFRVPPKWWLHPMASPASACAVMLTLHMADNLLNAMINPMFICAIGGLVAVGVTGAHAASQPAGQAVPRQMPRRPIAVPPPNMPSMGRPSQMAR